MENLVITDWSKTDINSFYSRAIAENPLAYSFEHQLWVASSYANCAALLTNSFTGIPQPGMPDALNKNAKLLISNLARLSDGEHHLETRAIAMLLYEKLMKIDNAAVLQTLLRKIDLGSPFDWVNEICKKLPLLCLLKGFLFPEEDCHWVLDNISSLIKIMQPHKTIEDVAEINPVVDHFFHLAKNNTPAGNEQRLLICNLIGLFIQSYDAGRGLLCNGLIRTAELKMGQSQNTDYAYIQKLIIEVLRIDSPVHNTRRVALGDIGCAQQVIKKGEQILLVLAAANLDPAVFDRPLEFDPLRANNNAHLSFGAGAHACIAKQFMIKLAADTCFYLYQNYATIDLIPQPFAYEPFRNVRLLKNMRLKLSPGENWAT